MSSDGGRTTPSSPPRDVVADRYRITGRLGRGGMGTVWQATDELLRRQVALKELHLPDDGLTARQAALRRDRALREARSAAVIRHPHVVVVHDVVEHQGHPWIVMELIDGLSLARLLERDGPLPAREAARIASAVAGALLAAHAHGIQHRDVKPANVLIERDTGRVALTDFGIARTPDSATISETGAFVGSPEYTAPERMSGRGAGPASDLWSLGALLCAAVHGESPFRRDSIGAIVHAVAIDEISPPEALGPLLPVVTRLLDRDPDRRMGAAEAERLLAALAATGEPPHPSAEAVEPPPDRDVSDRDAQHPDVQDPAVRDPDAPDPDAPVEGVPAPSVPGPAEPQTPVAVTPAPAGPATPNSRAHRAKGRPRGQWLPIAAVTALVVLAVGVSATVSLLVGGGHDGGGGSSGTGAAPPPWTASFSPPRRDGGPPGIPPPDGVHGPPPGAPGTPPLPPGHHLITDRTGFSVALPDGYVRDAHASRRYYWSPGRAFRFGEREQQPPDPRGPYTVTDAHRMAGPTTYPGYRDGTVTRTVQYGQPAALWEFTYDGLGDGKGARRVLDLCWTQNGRMYDLSLSAPLAQIDRARFTFGVARDTFRLPPASSAAP